MVLGWIVTYSSMRKISTWTSLNVLCPRAWISGGTNIHLGAYPQAHVDASSTTLVYERGMVQYPCLISRGTV
jgi:hypothetical protein